MEVSMPLFLRVFSIQILDVWLDALWNNFSKVKKKLLVAVFSILFNIVRAIQMVVSALGKGNINAGCNLLRPDVLILIGILTIIPLLLSIILTVAI